VTKTVNGTRRGDVGSEITSRSDGARTESSQRSNGPRPAFVCVLRITAGGTQ